MDKIVFTRRLANELEAILVALQPYQDGLASVGSTYNWYGLMDGLIGVGFDVRLANAIALKQDNDLTTHGRTFSYVIVKLMGEYLACHSPT